MGEFKDKVEIISGSTLQAYEQREEIPYGGIVCAIIGYVEDCETFTYQKTKNAKKFFLETCNLRREMVRWPKDDDSLPKQVLDVPAKSVVACVIRKYNHKGFSLQQIHVLREPINKKEKEK